MSRSRGSTRTAIATGIVLLLLATFFQSFCSGFLDRSASSESTDQRHRFLSMRKRPRPQHVNRVPRRMDQRHSASEQLALHRGPECSSTFRVECSECARRSVDRSHDHDRLRSAQGRHPRVRLAGDVELHADVSGSLSGTGRGGLSDDSVQPALRAGRSDDRQRHAASRRNCDIPASTPRTVPHDVRRNDHPHLRTGS